MFDPNKLINPVNDVMDSLTTKIPGVSLTIDNTVVKNVSLTNNYYNTLVVIDEIDSDKNVVRADREIVYNRVDIGNFIQSNSLAVKDNNGVVNYNIITDMVKRTTTDVDLTLLTDVLNKQFSLPVLESDMIMSERTLIKAKDTSFGPVFNTVNCAISGNTVTYTGGTVSVYQRPDTTEFKYNPSTTTRPGSTIQREWLCDEEFEITLPDTEEAGGWRLMVESLDSPYSKGNGKLWFEVIYDDLSGLWIYKSSKGIKQSFSSDSVSKIKISTTATNFKIECLVLVNNNSYEQACLDESVKLTHDSGFQRITLFSNNPITPITSIKLKSTPVIVDFKDELIPNINSYDGSQLRVSASPTSNALFGNVDKDIILTNYTTTGFVETPIYDKFAGDDDVSKGSITSIDTFSSQTGLTVSLVNPKLGQLFKRGVIKSISTELVNRLNTSVTYKVIFVADTIEGDNIQGSLKAYVNGTLNVDIEKTISADIDRINIEVVPTNMTVSTNLSNMATTTDNEYYDQTEVEKKYKTSFSIELNNDQIMPSFTILKAYPTANPL